MFRSRLKVKAVVLICAFTCLILSTTLTSSGATKANKQNNDFHNIVTIVEAECKNYKHVPPEVILGIIAKESGFNPRAVHKTKSGVSFLGAMQINNRSASSMLKRFYPREKVNLKKMLDPMINIKLGVWHFNNILASHKNNIETALTAYNLGEGGYQRRAASRGIYISPYARSVMELAKRYKIGK